MSMNMKFNITSSIGLILVLGAYSFLPGSCAILDNKAAELAEFAEVDSVPSYSYKIRQAYSHATHRARDADRISGDLSPVDSVTVAASEPTKILKRARGEPWSGEEEKLLLKLRGQWMSWAEINEFFPQRSWKALRVRYYKLCRDPSTENPPKKMNKWTAEEDMLLLKLKEENLPWMEIAKRFPTRNEGGLKSHYHHLRRGALAPEGLCRIYTAEEDKLLLELEELGIPWKQRAKLFENRSKQALKRQLRKISSVESPPPGLFTSEEDDSLFQALGSGKTVEEISQLLGRKSRGVERRIKILEQLNQPDSGSRAVPYPRYTDADLELIGRLREENVTWKDIGTKHFPERTVSGPKEAYYRYLKRKQKGQEEE